MPNSSITLFLRLNLVLKTVLIGNSVNDQKINDPVMVMYLLSILDVKTVQYYIKTNSSQVAIFPSVGVFSII